MNNIINLKSRVHILYKIIPIAILVAGIACSTGNKINVTGSENTLDTDSILVDKDGNRYQVKKMLDKKLWMTTNLKLNVDSSYCYDNVQVNCDKYGRLYTWQSAILGCRILGDGWHLPTNAEWQELADMYRPAGKDSIELRKKAYQPLLYSGNSGFNALQGGARRSSSEFARLDAHGFYWTSTASDSITAGFANFAKGSQSLYIQNDGEKAAAFSVRCVKVIIH